MVLGDLAFGCAGVGLFAACRVLGSPVDGRLPDRLLAGLLALCSLNVVHPFLPFHSAVPGPLVIEPLQFLIPLFLVWYLRALQRAKVFRPWDAVLLVLPFASIAASYQPLFSDPTAPGSRRLFSLAMWGTMAVLSSLLLVPVATGIARYRKDLQSVYSNLTGVDPGWLRGLLVALGLLFLVYAVLAVVIVHAPPQFPLGPWLGLLMGMVTVYLSWKSLQRKPRLAPEPAQPEVPTEWSEWAVLIRQRLEASRLYLNPDLTLDDVARAVGLTRHEVSAALNRGLGESFFDVVNGLRVAEFQRLCRDPKKAHEKILTLALDAGFNSKPAFNQVFKKVTGRTPSDYRRNPEIVS